MPCWVKVFLVCSESKKGLGACASYETVCKWVNAVKNEQEKDYASRSGAQTLVIDNTTWNK
jgi:hypothetical protein